MRAPRSPRVGVWGQVVLASSLAVGAAGSAREDLRRPPLHFSLSLSLSWTDSPVLKKRKRKQAPSVLSRLWIYNALESFACRRLNSDRRPLLVAALSGTTRVVQSGQRNVKSLRVCARVSVRVRRPLRGPPPLPNRVL